MKSGMSKVKLQKASIEMKWWGFCGWFPSARTLDTNDVLFPPTQQNTGFWVLQHSNKDIENHFAFFNDYMDIQ